MCWPDRDSFDPATATWYLRNSNNPGAPDFQPFQFGAPSWIPVVGDWDGNGTTTIGVVDPATMTWYLRNSNSPGAPDITPFRYGAVGWKPIAGDWNGDGKASVGVYDLQGVWYLRNSNSPGAPDITPFQYGAGNWIPVAGAWTAAPLVLHAAGGKYLPEAAPVPAAELSPIVQAALTRLSADGIDAATLARLSATAVTLSPLPAGTLGLADPTANRIVLDDNGAGYGWFVDPTPLQDEEFAADGSALTGSAAAGHEDLLTAVLHEMGHIAGLLDDGTTGVMAAALVAGTRHLPGGQAGF